LRNKAHSIRGYAFIASATFCWGISAALGRAAFTGRLLSGHSLPPLDPLILAQSRTTFALMVLAPVLLAWRGWQQVLLPKADLIRCLVLGVLGVAASNYFYYLAIQKTNVATAIILQYTAPVWVLLYMVVRRLQRATVQRMASVGLAVIGCALVIGIIGGGRLRLDPVGVGSALLAAFSFAFYNVGGHGLLAKYDRWRVLVWALLGAAACWIVINPPWKVVAEHYSPAQWLFLAGFSVTSVLVPFSLYFAGLQHLDATRAIVTSCLEPVFSILITAAALGEVVRPLQAVGIAVVLAATILVQLPSGEREQATVLEPVD
jgi:drug/metabolite transporter, DME family